MHLAQLNIASAKYPMDSEEMKGFVDNLAPINAIAESSEGFIWRLQDESGDATGILAFEDPNILINMSVWASIPALKHFMFKTFHKDFLSRKKEWFETPSQNNYVLWWVPIGHIPTMAEGLEKLRHLNQFGETTDAFTFKTALSYRS